MNLMEKILAMTYFCIAWMGVRNLFINTKEEELKETLKEG